MANEPTTEASNPPSQATSCGSYPATVCSAPNGLTIRQLKDWIARLPDTDPETGEDRGVWIATGRGLSSQVYEIWPLNCDGRSCDILFQTLEDDNQTPRVKFSESFNGLPLRKVEFLCGQGGSVVSVTVKDKHGNLATVDEWAKVLWHMSDEQALAYDIEVGRKPNPNFQAGGAL